MSDAVIREGLTLVASEEKEIPAIRSGTACGDTNLGPSLPSSGYTKSDKLRRVFSLRQHGLGICHLWAK